MEVVSKEIMYEIFSWWISFLVAIQTLNKLVSTLKVPGNIRTFLGMNWMNMNFPQHTLSRKHKGGLPQLLKTKNSPTCDTDTLPLETNWLIPSDAYAKRRSNSDKKGAGPRDLKDSAGHRHGIYQMFYTSQIPEIVNFPRKNALVANFLTTNWEWRMFCSTCDKFHV